MRVDPVPHLVDKTEFNKKRMDKVMKYVALVIAFASTFSFFFKLLFF